MGIQHEVTPTIEKHVDGEYHLSIYVHESGQKFGFVLSDVEMGNLDEQFHDFEDAKRVGKLHGQERKDPVYGDEEDVTIAFLVMSISDQIAAHLHTYGECLVTMKLDHGKPRIGIENPNNYVVQTGDPARVIKGSYPIAHLSEEAPSREEVVQELTAAIEAVKELVDNAKEIEASVKERNRALSIGWAVRSFRDNGTYDPTPEAVLERAKQFYAWVETGQ